jgi:hypothetical protein
MIKILFEHTVRKKTEQEKRQVLFGVTDMQIHI